MSEAAVADFDWALVRSFLAVLDAGSVSAAAKRSGARQPTLSRHVAELEAQLGAPLFERTGRGVVPTAAALAIVDASRRMQEAALALGRGLANARSLTRGVVRVTTSQVAATWLLPPVLSRLQREHPQIEIELVASNELTNLLRREADIAVRMVRPVQQSLIARKLGEIEIVAAAHKGYLAKAAPLRLAAALTLPASRTARKLRTGAQSKSATAASGMRKCMSFMPKEVWIGRLVATTLPASATAFDRRSP